jgi:hypothetical protein
MKIGGFKHFRVSMHRKDIGLGPGDKIWRLFVDVG